MPNSKRVLLLRNCRFEVLEPRQVLSSLGLFDPAAQLLQPMVKLNPYAGPSKTPMGFTPAQIQKAYSFDKIVFPGGIPGDGRGTTIAIVDAFNNPTILADLKTFNTQFNLPQFNVAGGPTFKIVNQNGNSATTFLPTNDQGWGGEIALDVEWAHAIAPAANILLVETSSDLFTAVDFARRQPGVVVVSNSWGGPEYLGENAVDPFFAQPAGHAGVSFTVAAGDSGAPASSPSSSPNVVSVGGTTLKLNALNNWSSETVWNLGGGGPSQYFDASGLAHPGQGVPSFQQGLGLTSRGTPDVAYNADLASGVAVFSTYALGGWQQIGGTSAGAPQWAALIAIADQGRALSGKNSLSNAQVALYAIPRSDYHDIIKGNNGNPTTIGYDVASGLGSPIANLVVRDLVAFNGSTFVRTTTSSSGVPSSGWFPFLMNRSLGSRSIAEAVDVVINTSVFTATDADRSAGRWSSLTGNSNISLAQTETDEPKTATVDLSAAQRVSAAADWALEGMRGSRRRSDSALSCGLLDEVIAQL